MAITRSRLRKFRKHAHLSQRELAFLVGVGSQGLMSEMEAGRKRPGLDIGFAMEIAFGIYLRDAYPGDFTLSENIVFERAVELHTELASKPNRSEAASYVAALISRLDGTNTTV